jgi:hypothetical protein
MGTKIAVLIVSIVCLNISVIAQSEISKSFGKWDNQIFIKDVNGLPISAKYIDVEGTPYFIKDFKFGTIELKNSRKFIDVPLKLDLVMHEITFLSPNKEEGIIGNDFVKDLTLVDTTEGVIKHYLFRPDLPAIDNHKAKEFCMILADGPITLVKSMVKKIDTRKNELSGEISKDFALYEDFFTFQNGEMSRFKRDKTFILNLFSKKATLIEAFIKENKGSFKNEDYLASIFNYYNSL